MQEARQSTAACRKRMERRRSGHTRVVTLQTHNESHQALTPGPAIG